MRPVKIGPLSPITALTTAFNAQTFTSTGAATAPTTTTTTDGLAHQVTLVSPAQATLAGVVGATAVRVLTNTVTNGATYTLMTSQPSQQTG